MTFLSPAMEGDSPWGTHLVGEEFKHNAPDGPPIDHWSVPHSYISFWSAISHAGYSPARIGAATLKGSIIGQDTCTKITDANGIGCAIVEHILRLEIPVDDAHPVKLIQADSLL